MLKKNLDKIERNKRRPAPIPYTRIGKSKKDVLDKMRTKHKGKNDMSYCY